MVTNALDCVNSEHHSSSGYRHCDAFKGKLTVSRNFAIKIFVYFFALQMMRRFFVPSVFIWVKNSISIKWSRQTENIVKVLQTPWCQKKLNFRAKDYRHWNFSFSEIVIDSGQYSNHLSIWILNTKFLAVFHFSPRQSENSIKRNETSREDLPYSNYS